MKHPLYQEPDVTPTIKCPACRETLLYGRESCQYCGEEIDPDYAVRNALKEMALARACSWANNLRTANLMMIILAALTIMQSIGSGGRTLTPLILTMFYCGAFVAWCWRYADIETDDADFIEARRAMKRYLHSWLAFSALEAFLIFIRLYH